MSATTMSYEAPSQSSHSSSSNSMSGSTVHGFPILQVKQTTKGCVKVAAATIVEKHHRGWRFYCAFGTIFLATFIIALDGTILSVALPTLTRKVHASTLEGYWCGSSFLLASTVIQPPVTSLSHIFGRKPALMVSLIVFTAGCIVAALAKRIVPLLVGRTLQGLGSGGILALTYVIVADLVSLRERGKWFGLISLSWALGSVSGPLVGGALVGDSWPWLFWINLPFCGIAFFAIIFILDLRPKEGAIMTKLKNTDWIGTFLFMASLTGFLVPLSWGGVMYPWSSPRTFAPLMAGIVGMAFFGYWIKLALHLKIDPIMRPSMFRSATSASAYVSTIIHGMVIWGYLYYLPLYYEIRGASPVEAGRNLLPCTLSVAPTAIATGFLISKTGHYRSLLWAGWAITTLGSGLLNLLNRETQTYEWVIFSLLVGVGLGMLYSAQAFASQAAASDEDLPFAAGFYAFCRSLGQTFGVVIGSVIFQNEFRNQVSISPRIAANVDEFVKDASALVELVKEGGKDIQPVVSTIVDAFITSLQTLWMVLCILCGAALLVSVIGVRHKSLDRELVTDQGV